MPQITALEPGQRRRDRLNLHVDGEFLMSVSQQVADEQSLRVGQPVDAALIARLRSRDEFQQAFDRALRFLATRPRSEQEIRQNLARKGIPPDLHDGVVERLRHLGYVDDAAFARFWTENRERFNPRGERLLKAELRRKGVEVATIDETIADVVDEASGAEAVALKQARRLAKLEYQTFRQRLWAYLARRGFDYDMIPPAIETAWKTVTSS